MAPGRPAAIPAAGFRPWTSWSCAAPALEEVAVRIPAVRVIDVESAGRPASTAAFVHDAVRACGSVPDGVEKAGRDAASIAAALDGQTCDLVILVGGTGRGRTDATAAALAECGALIAHGIALLPGETAAVGRLGTTPVVALPGMADHAPSGLSGAGAAAARPPVRTGGPARPPCCRSAARSPRASALPSSSW